MASNTSTPTPEQEFQTLQHYLNEFTQQIELFSQQFQIIEQARMEIISSIETLRGLKDTNNAVSLLPVGGGAAILAQVIDPDSVIVSIGSDVSVRKTNDEAVSYLMERITEMEAQGKRLAETIQKLQAQASEVGRRLEQLYQAGQGQTTGRS
ncbi:MAG: prefoldin subunit alpha [Methanocalculus sp.]|uniref:prefoldin subunit alpha n=1 Tax=Methanocalculus sp. TaxID=2004547 RepID=UPI00271C5BA0|nr:prefoldin subunit alpha [Methanocalculus sp.]MDO8841419.1 prefoldin subunit alpha [Methanocalculus sp.]MDO9540101.1 prefoldin subunit alpha [Methanocalculus sp.]